MATDPGFVEHLRDQSAAAGGRSAVTFKKMFGEYALYLDGKVVALACNNQLFLKPTEPGRAALGRVTERPAYPGSKPYFLIDEQLDDADLLSRLFRVTADALPPPAPKRRAPAARKTAGADAATARRRKPLT